MTLTHMLAFFLAPFASCAHKPVKSERSRYLLPHEWSKIKAVLDHHPLKVRVYFYILLLEGSRMSEARHMQWGHLDLKDGFWYKPITKTKRAQTIALSQQACLLLGALPRRGSYVFHGERPDLPWSQTAVEYHWRKIRREAGCPDVQIRDLRRTCASWMAMRGESTLVIQQILNHQSLAVTQVYARLNNESVRAALTRHAERVFG